MPAKVGMILCIPGGITEGAVITHANCCKSCNSKRGNRYNHMPTELPREDTMTTETIKTIDIGKKFAIAPHGAHYVGSADSGEWFREEFLRPIFTDPKKYSRPVNIVLDSVPAYSAAFLNAAFGGLVREGYATPKEIRDDLKLVFKKDEGFELYERLILRFIAEAAEWKEQKLQGVEHVGENC